MGVLEITMWLYLSGAVSITGYQVYDCNANPSRVYTTTECCVIGVLNGIVWPVMLADYAEQLWKGR